MWGLIYKDIIVHKKTLLISLAGTLVLAFLFSMPVFITGEPLDETMVSTLSLLVAFAFFVCWLDIPTVFISGDERAKWSDFSASSAAMVKGQVGSKYCEGIIVLVFIVNLAYCALQIPDLVLYKMWGISGMSSSVSFAIIFAFMLMAVWSVEMPFTIYFGSKYGGYVKMVLFGILFLIIMIYGLYGNINISFDKIWEILFAEEPGVGYMAFMAFFPIFSGVLYFLSYKLSCKLYLKGAERFE